MKVLLFVLLNKYKSQKANGSQSTPSSGMYWTTKSNHWCPFLQLLRLKGLFTTSHFRDLVKSPFIDGTAWKSNRNHQIPRQVVINFMPDWCESRLVHCDFQRASKEYEVQWNVPHSVCLDLSLSFLLHQWTVSYQFQRNQRAECLLFSYLYSGSANRWAKQLVEQE